MVALLLQDLRLVTSGFRYTAIFFPEAIVALFGRVHSPMDHIRVFLNFERFDRIK